VDDEEERGRMQWEKRRKAGVNSPSSLGNKLGRGYAAEAKKLCP
jgi:hypothetical protein